MQPEAIYERLNEAYFSENCHEKVVIDHLGELLDGRKLFVDIGASLGQFTRRANQLMQDGKIIAIEADPVRFEELKRNCQLWENESTNQIVPVHAALCRSSGKVTFFTTNSNVSGGISKRNVAADVQWDGIEVPAMTLDEVLADAVPDLVKMDVEGAEMDILLGAENTVRKQKTCFLVEIHGSIDEGTVAPPKLVVPFLRSNGYGQSSFHGKPLFKPGTLSYRQKFRLWKDGFLRGLGIRSELDKFRSAERPDSAY
ncbi:FkbM family methyltransferase [Bremerella sp. JC770]|uniref:FkbM family methyltransferase n=1 Tax=Bremerella sp. JC770 TaxID=3232137 RepID=UPI00345AEC8B